MSQNYDYKIEAIEQFLDGVYQRAYDFAVRAISEFKQDVDLLDLTNYSGVDEQVKAIKKERARMEDEVRDKQWAILREYKPKFAVYYDKVRATNTDERMCWNVSTMEEVMAEMFPDMHKEYQLLNKQYLKDDKAVRAEYDFKGLKVRSDAVKLLKSKAVEQKKSLQKFYKNHPLAKHFELLDVQKMTIEECAEKWAEVDRENLRQDIYSRTEAYVGKLVDMTDIHFGENGSLNGIVIGEDGRRAHVFTIIAGGYNIQREHYRVLVKP